MSEIRSGSYLCNLLFLLWVHEIGPAVAQTYAQMKTSGRDLTAARKTAFRRAAGTIFRPRKFDLTYTPGAYFSVLLRIRLLDPQTHGAPKNIKCLLFQETVQSANLRHQRNARL
jgi:hypothetical protein